MCQLLSGVFAGLGRGFMRVRNVEQDERQYSQRCLNTTSDVNGSGLKLRLCFNRLGPLLLPSELRKAYKSLHRPRLRVRFTSTANLDHQPISIARLDIDIPRNWLITAQSPGSTPEHSRNGSSLEAHERPFFRSGVRGWHVPSTSIRTLHQVIRVPLRTRWSAQARQCGTPSHSHYYPRHGQA